MNTFGSLMDVSDQKKLLAVLLLFMAVTVIYRFLNPVRQERVASLTYTGAPKASAAETAEQDRIGDFQAMVGLMEAPPVHPGDVISGHFFQTMSAPSPPPQASESESESPPELPLDLESETLDALPAPAPETPESRVHRDLSRLKVLGLYASGRDRAVFFQRNKQTLVVRKGDRIDGKYLVTEITADAITLEAEHLKEKVHIDLKPFLKPHERKWMQ